MFVDFLRKYTSRTQEVVKVPFIGSIYWKLVLELEFAKIDKRGVQIRSGSMKNFQKIDKRGWRLLSTKEYTSLLDTLDFSGVFRLRIIKIGWLQT